MTTVIELEKIEVPILRRKKFCTDEVYKMMEIGILPEESGWELIDGEIIHQMPIGSRHASIVRKLEKYLERNFGDKVIVSGQNPIHINKRNEPEPDIALLKFQEDFYAENHPTPEDVLILIEVADSTLSYDREIKKTLYAQAEIIEFWLVNLKQNTVEIYTNPSNGIYHQMQIFEYGQKIQSKSLPDLVLTTGDILGEETSENDSEN